MVHGTPKISLSSFSHPAFLASKSSRTAPAPALLLQSYLTGVYSQLFRAARGSFSTDGFAGISRGGLTEFFVCWPSKAVVSWLQETASSQGLLTDPAPPCPSQLSRWNAHRPRSARSNFELQVVAPAVAYGPCFLVHASAQVSEQRGSLNGSRSRGTTTPKARA